MIRMSLVNLYSILQQSPNLQITHPHHSKRRKTSRISILANPPFMFEKAHSSPTAASPSRTPRRKRSPLRGLYRRAPHPHRTRRHQSFPEGIIFQRVQTAYQKSCGKCSWKKAFVAVGLPPGGFFQSPTPGGRPAQFHPRQNPSARRATTRATPSPSSGWRTRASPWSPTPRPSEKKRHLLRSGGPITNFKIANYEWSKADEQSFIPNSQFLIVPKSKISANGGLQPQRSVSGRAEPVIISFRWSDCVKLSARQ